MRISQRIRWRPAANTEAHQPNRLASATRLNVGASSAVWTNSHEYVTVEPRAGELRISSHAFDNRLPEVSLPRDLVNATVGFEALAEMTTRPAKSLHRMLSRHGNPSMDNLAAIFDALRQRLKVGIEARTVTAA